MWIQKHFIVWNLRYFQLWILEYPLKTQTTPVQNFRTRCFRTSESKRLGDSKIWMANSFPKSRGLKSQISPFVNCSVDLCFPRNLQFWHAESEKNKLENLECFSCVNSKERVRQQCFGSFCPLNPEHCLLVCQRKQDGNGLFPVLNLLLELKLQESPVSKNLKSVLEKWPG